MKKGFTILEMIIVLTIVALLYLLTIPNIQQKKEIIDNKGCEIWIRHVVVPGITQNDKYLYKLGEFIGTLKHVKALDVLPYHTMGAVKYQNLGMKYPLDGVRPLEKQEAIAAREVIKEGIRAARKKLKEKK